MAAYFHSFDFGDDFEQLCADPGFDQDEFFGIHEQEMVAVSAYVRILVRCQMLLFLCMLMTEGIRR